MNMFRFILCMGLHFLSLGCMAIPVAQWITSSSSQSATNTWICFRKDISIAHLSAGEVPLSIAADSKYWLWINGRLVVFEGGVKRGPNPHDTYYDTVDIGPYLQEGENKLSFLVWYFGKEGFSYQPSGKAGLYVASQSDKIDLHTDSSWMSMLHPSYYTPAGMQPNFRLPESNIGYDARLSDDKWISTPVSQLAYPWAPSVAVGEAGCSPWGELHPRIIPQWKDYGIKSYQTVQWKYGNLVDTLVCSLPYNMQMTPLLEVVSEAGKVIGMQTDNYQGGGMPNVRAEYITRDGQQLYESLGWMNGQCVYYTIPHGVKLIKASYRETSYDTEFAGWFTCNDPFYNLLWEKAQRTLLVTMRDTYMDCPDRERAQWWGDEVIESGEAFYALCPQSHLLMKKGMYELIGWQRRDGVIFSPVPASNYHTELPGQMLSSIGRYGFWNYYLCTGDTATIADLYPGVKRYLNVWQYQEDGTIRFRSGEWTWGDWGTNIDIQGLFNAWYYLALEGAANMAELLGLSAEACSYRQEMVQLKEAFNRVFWTGEAYQVDKSLPTPDDRLQALAVVAGLADASRYPALLKLFKTYEHASPYMEKYVLEALFEMNEPDEALRRMKRRFSSMVNHPDYTTLFEGWGIGAAGYGGGTTNHAWSGGGLTLLSEKVCGIAPIAPGFSVFSVIPQMGTLTEVSTSLLTVNGRISVELKRKGNAVEVKLSVPAGAKAVVPFQKVKHIKYVSKKTLANKKQIRLKGMDGYLLGEGTWTYLFY